MAARFCRRAYRSTLQRQHLAIGPQARRRSLMITSLPSVEPDVKSATRTIRVLHLHAGNMIGGIESFLMTLAECACNCPMLQSEMALAFDGPLAEAIRQRGMKVHPLPPVQLRNPLSVLRSRRALKELLRSSTFDAVISHSPWCQVVYGPASRSIPVAFWMHGAFDGHWLQRLASRHQPDL